MKYQMTRRVKLTEKELEVIEKALCETGNAELARHIGQELFELQMHNYGVMLEWVDPDTTGGPSWETGYSASM